MRYLKLCTVAIVIGFLSGCQRDISGAYLATDKASVAWLQLVRTPDNHLTGQLAVSSLRPDGTIEKESVSLTGAVDAENVTLSGSKFFGLATFTLAGVLRGGSLTLSGGAEPTPIVFNRASFTDYQRQANDLNSKSLDIQNAKAEAEGKQRADRAAGNFVSQIDQLIDNMQRFDAEADVHLGRFPSVEKGYQAMTAKIAANVERERQLASNPNASVARSQLSVAANQISLQTEQLHNQGGVLQTTLQSNVKPLADLSITLTQQCAITTPQLTSAQNEERRKACNRLSNAAPQFRQKYEATAVGLNHLEQVYQREKSIQQELLQSALKLE